MQGKAVKDSQVLMTEIVHPGDTNPLGTIFGGTVFKWIDMAAAMCAMRHTRSNVVTASIDALDFLCPVKIGYFVILKASVNYTGKTSMEIGVRVESEHPITGEVRLVAKSFLTFVSIDEHGKPKAVPAVIPQTEIEKKRYEMAQRRREHRVKFNKDKSNNSHK
ncbi:MAG: acyl-CoA thioesterase [Deltaproteobacteria bacterium]|nr:acyl-CoA thioesterase [Deltaproteobacteria bacterium]